MSPLILALCAAYESGFGQGFEGRATENPYRMSDLDSFEAWEYGHQQGMQRRAVAETPTPLASKTESLANELVILEDFLHEFPTGPTAKAFDRERQAFARIKAALTQDETPAALHVHVWNDHVPGVEDYCTKCGFRPNPHESSEKTSTEPGT